MEYKKFVRDRSPLLRRTLGWLPFLIIIAVASALRLYSIPETIIFHDDQGLDMLVVRLMETAGYRPLVGPYLTVENVFTPPTYYYITWLFHRVTRSIPGIVYGYALMNITGLFLLMKLASDIAGRRYALVTGILYAVSSAMIGHGRSFWQPYPIQPFIIAALLSLWHAISGKSTVLLWISLFSYMAAVSVYPSAVLLLPFFLFQLYRWHRRIAVLSPFRSVVYTACTAGLSFIALFMPQILYEARHGFPTVNAYISSGSSVHPPVMERIFKIGDNLVGLSTTFVPIDWSFPGQYRMVVALHLAAAVLLFRRLRLPASIGAFMAPWTLAAGLSMLYFQTNAVYAHHMWAYLPFLFLITGYMVNRALEGTVRQKLLGSAFILLFTFCNARDSRRFFTAETTDNIGQVRAVTDFIRHDMTSRHISQSETVFFHTYPEYASFGTDVFYRAIYWLAESGTIRPELTPSGNDFRLNPPSTVPKTHAYVICVRYPTDEEMRRCVAKIPSLSGYRILDRKQIGNMSVLALTREIR